jgi:hypothetical protein
MFLRNVGIYTAPKPRTSSSGCKTVLLNFVHRLNYAIIKLQRFETWILLSLSGKKMGRTEKVSVGPPGSDNLRHDESLTFMDKKFPTN